MNIHALSKELYPYLKNHLGKLILTSVLMILATVLESSIPEITGRIIDNLFTGDRDKDIAMLYAGGLFAVILVSSLLSITSMATSSWVSNKVIMDIRVNMFDRLIKLPKKYFDKNATGEIMSKLTFDVEQVANAASSIWLEFIKSSIAVIVLISYLFYKNWQLSLTLIILLPLMFFVVKQSSERMRSSSKRIQSSMGEMTHLLDENISGIDLIKIYHAQRLEKLKFKGLINNIRQQRFKVDMTSGLNAGIVNVLIGLSLGSVVYLSSTTLNMTGGEFLSFFTAMAMIVKPGKNLVNINKPLQQAVAGGESVFGLLREKEEVNDGKVTLDKARGLIEFKNVGFSYDGQSPVLSDFNLKIKPGETVAIVGATGSGKSTIAQLLNRFYEVEIGGVYLDGCKIEEYEINSLRKQISYVDQSVMLFNDTVANNVSLGQVGQMRKEDIDEAINSSNSKEFVEKMEEGINASVGENGERLSGGQRQRLAIARAMAKDCPILILDEATSALDPITEKLIQNSVDKMRSGRTTIIIAHRLSTVKRADRIIVLGGGKVMEQGSHNALIKLNGYYAKLNKDLN